MTEENSQEQAPDDGPIAYEDMSWQKLKALMTAEGQDWVNAEHAIEYLNKLDESDDSESSDDIAEAEEDSSQEVDAGTDSDPEKNAEEDPAPDGTDESTDAGVTDDADSDVIGNDDLVDSPVDDVPCFNPDDKHGVISGQCNARYWQDGCHFDSQGQYIAPEDVVVESEETG